MTNKTAPQAVTGTPATNAPTRRLIPATQWPQIHAWPSLAGLLIDLAVTLLTLVIHWGTFSGLMAATFAGLLTSIGTTFAKKAFGHIEGDVYLPGYINLKV